MMIILIFFINFTFSYFFSSLSPL
jgi:hypothetical protein